MRDTNPPTALPLPFTASQPKQKHSRAKSRQLRRLQPKINGEALHLKDRYTFTPPPSREAHYERLKEIVKESANSTKFNSMKQKTLKVDDIVHSASKLKAEYLKRAKSPVYKTNYSHGSLYGNYSSVEGQEYSEHIKPSSRRTLVVKIPAISDTLASTIIAEGRIQALIFHIGIKSRFNLKNNKLITSE